MERMVFNDGVDDYWARQRVQERLTEVELPYNATPGLNPLTSPTGEIFRYVLESDSLDRRELTDLHKWVIIPRLKQVTGVADVSNFGGITTQYQIEVDPHKMEEYNITLNDITEKIEKNNVNAGGSMLSQAREVMDGKIYSYNRGEVSLLEVLDAQRTYDDVQAQYIETLFNQSAALVELEKSAGIWDVEL